MSLAMLGLVAFQWYWIENAIAVRKEQFNRNVNEAMQETIKKIEKNEVIYLAKQKMLAQEQQKLVAITQKKSTETPHIQVISQNIEPLSNDFRDLNKIPQVYPTHALSDVIGQDFFNIPERQIDFIRAVLEENNVIWEELNQPSREAILRQKSIEGLMQVVNSQMMGLHFRVDSAKIKQKFSPRNQVVQQTYWVEDSTGFRQYYYNETIPQNEKNVGKTKQNATQKTIQERYQRAENKANLVKDVLKDVITGNRNIYERLNRLMLDTLLRKELQNRGISIPFDYGVKNGSNMVFSSFAVNYSPNLLENAYTSTLFPNDAFPTNTFLYVYFPEKQNFILRNMWLVFVSSALLILVIGSVFYSSVSTILMQKKLSEIKNDFINNMTHEFKTPISTISLATEVLKDDSVKKDSVKMNRYLNVIQDENKRLGTQVEKVLQMAQLDKGEVKLKLGIVNIHEVIEQVLQNLSVQIEQKNGIVNLELDAESPELEADEVHLTNIIYNLLDNANKYSPENSEITIQTENKDNTLIIKVLDKGIGMTKEQVSKIFEKFYRVPTGNLHDVKGFGLGLSYVKKMVESHNGEIHVESKIGEGSAFEIVLPIFVQS
jgi:two-component system, OmpR family, phosphate regulon sensor histidine kinase PhoR